MSRLNQAIGIIGYSEDYLSSKRMVGLYVNAAGTLFYGLTSAHISVARFRRTNISKISLQNENQVVKSVPAEWIF